MLISPLWVGSRWAGRELKRGRVRCVFPGGGGGVRRGSRQNPKMETKPQRASCLASPLSKCYCPHLLAFLASEPEKPSPCPVPAVHCPTESARPPFLGTLSARRHPIQTVSLPKADPKTAPALHSVKD